MHDYLCYLCVATQLRKDSVVPNNSSRLRESAAQAASRAKRQLADDLERIDQALTKAFVELAWDHGADGALRAADEQYGTQTAGTVRDGLTEAGWTYDHDADVWMDPDTDRTAFLDELRLVQASGGAQAAA